ncbi:heme exporter protein CcmD [Halovulum dunhuangense]|uniref:Heme exporter protein D n=1 Tax=Halovulum dunhuangense TaxID=1505036 RepID=A0A849L3V1_9RHOB|nr:heme exporter protein CcmD [Halovulum dunhuangense]NNU81009.1 heme exporter protein CcmD [Halovulum dunhuangense]
MPELGPYAGAVLSAYAVSILLIGALVALSLRRAAKMRAALRRAEKKEGATHV